MPQSDKSHYLIQFFRHEHLSPQLQDTSKLFGDLARRIPQAHPKTEIGRLSASLNSMLGQIETAFGAQTRSEAEASARTIVR